MSFSFQERKKFQSLDEARKAAEEQVKAARAKLEATEVERKAAADRVEAAKERARKMKVPVGLARPLTVWKWLFSLLFFYEGVNQ